MFLRLVFVFVIIFTANAVDIKSALSKYPVLQQCARTFRMFDASAKLPDGILSANWMELGHFDQCLAIDEVTKGKYCLMKIAFPNPINVEKSKALYEVFGNHFFDFPEIEQSTKQNSSNIEERIGFQIDGSPGIILGWCVPHTCPIDKLAEVLTSVVQKIQRNMKVLPLLDDGQCQTKDDLVINYNTGSIIFITFLCATLFLMTASTLYDVYIQHYEKKPAHIILIAFSVKTNGTKLLSVSNNPDQLPCLNGIRFLSMMWVIYGHRAASSFMEPIINMGHIKKFSNNVGNMYIFNAQVCVDSFFLLSGLLVGYGYCLAMNKGVKFNIILYYLHRILRLIPLFVVVIWFHVTIFEYFGSGPFWPFVTSSLKDPCTNYWWSTLIFIHNYYPGRDLCISQSWYLAIDMQLFILSPLILIPLWKWPKQTMFACGILVLGSMAIPFTITYVNDLPAFVLSRESKKYMKQYYFPTHTRFGPWLMGLMLGYYIFTIKKNKNNRITLKPLTAILGWIVAIGVLVSALFSGHDLMINPDKLGNSFFNGFHRHGWALGLCWVIYACTQGYGGPINSFLCFSLFQILCRFTYSMYLVHLSLMYAIAGTSRTSNYFSDFHSMYYFWGDFMISFFIAVCVTLAYESPMITIEKVLFKTGPKSKKLEPELPAHSNITSSEGGQTNKGYA